jgi:2-oxoglutarate ferredoxin oxidoreductase subunit beta
MGSIDHPFNPLALCMGADATFIARTMDRDPKHMREMLKRSNDHKGSSLLEIYQNCNVFNDGAFFGMTDKATKMNQTLFLEDGEPLLFGENKSKGIKLDGFKPIVVSMEDTSADDLWIHDEKDLVKAGLLTRFFDDEMPRPFGVFYSEDRILYEDALVGQIEEAKELKGKGNLDDLLKGSNTWSID